SSLLFPVLCRLSPAPPCFPQKCRFPGPPPDLLFRSSDDRLVDQFQRFLVLDPSRFFLGHISFRCTPISCGHPCGLAADAFEQTVRKRCLPPYLSQRAEIIRMIFPFLRICRDMPESEIVSRDLSLVSCGGDQHRQRPLDTPSPSAVCD